MSHDFTPPHLRTAQADTSTTDLAGKRVVVTGGAGFLGAVVVHKLRERGVDVAPPALVARVRAACHDPQMEAVWSKAAEQQQPMIFDQDPFNVHRDEIPRLA